MSTIFPLSSLYSWCGACCCCYEAGRRILTFLSLGDSIFPSSSSFFFSFGLSGRSLLYSILFRLTLFEILLDPFAFPIDTIPALLSAQRRAKCCWLLAVPNFYRRGCQIAALGGVVNSAHLEFFLVYSILLARDDFAALA
jgi:hypothetical protein